MTDVAGVVAGAPAAPVRGKTHYAVELIDNWDEATRRLSADMAQEQMTPFQHRHWLSAWYASQNGDPNGTPLIAVVRDRRRNSVLAILPLVIRRESRLRIAEFAGGSDYNAPILGAAAADQPIEPPSFWQAVRLALAAAPGGCDLVRFSKMPLTIAGVPNPLASLAATDPCALTGHRLEPGDDYNAYRYSRDRTVRKELERSWRVFTRHDGARLERITEPARALQVFATLEQQQSARMRELGHDYALDDAASSAFHRDLIGRGIGDGYVVLTALTCGEAIVAALLGIRIGATYLMVRISHGGGEWANCSPGRLIIERSMAALHDEGVRTFDFSVGTYDYKRRFGVQDVPLRNLIVPISWRGRAAMAANRAVSSLRAILTRRQ